MEIIRSIVAEDNRALISFISINKLSYIIVKTLLVVFTGD
jgi:hypothetical protein